MSPEFIRSWTAALRRPPGLERLEIAGSRAGPPGKDLEIQLSGADILTIKEASLDLQEILRGIGGVERIVDDTPFGKEQIVVELTPLGQRLGLDAASIGRQLRNALDGSRAQRLNEGVDEVEVRIKLSDQDRLDVASLQKMQIRLPNGGFAPLVDLVGL